MLNKKIIVCTTLFCLSLSLGFSACGLKKENESLVSSVFFGKWKGPSGDFFVINPDGTVTDPQNVLENNRNLVRVQFISEQKEIAKLPQQVIRNIIGKASKNGAKYLGMAVMVQTHTKSFPPFIQKNDTSDGTHKVEYETSKYTFAYVSEDEYGGIHLSAFMRVDVSVVSKKVLFYDKVALYVSGTDPTVLAEKQV